MDGFISIQARTIKQGAPDFELRGQILREYTRGMLRDTRPDLNLNFTWIHLQRCFITNTENDLRSQTLARGDNNGISRQTQRARILIDRYPHLSRVLQNSAETRQA